MGVLVETFLQAALRISAVLTGEEGTAGGGPSGGRGLAHILVHRETRDARGPSMNRGGLWSVERSQPLLVYLANLWRAQSHTPTSPTVSKETPTSFSSSPPPSKMREEKKLLLFTPHLPPKLLNFIP